jgi:hypothetical protein
MCSLKLFFLFFCYFGGGVKKRHFLLVLRDPQCGRIWLSNTSWILYTVSLYDFKESVIPTSKIQGTCTHAVYVVHFPHRDKIYVAIYVTKSQNTTRFCSLPLLSAQTISRIFFLAVNNKALRSWALSYGMCRESLFFFFFSLPHLDLKDEGQIWDFDIRSELFCLWTTTKKKKKKKKKIHGNFIFHFLKNLCVFPLK